MPFDALHPNPEGIYLHSVAPDWLHESVVSVIGPYFVLLVSLSVLAGSNLVLYCLYMQQFGGRKGDRWYIQLLVSISVAINLSFAIFSVQSFYVRNFVTMYTPLGYDMNEMEPYVVPAHILQAIPDAIGQTYFVLRIAKLFDGRRLRIKIATGVALFAIMVQWSLMVYFGVTFYEIRTKVRLAQDTDLRSRIRRIIGLWAALFITIEFAMTTTTIARLLVLRRRSKMDHARKIIFNLAVYSLQGQIALTTISILTTYSFLKSTEGFYSPMYLCAGSCYTVVLIANLLYRTTVSHEMREAQSSINNSHGTVPNRSVCVHGCLYNEPGSYNIGQRHLSQYEPAPCLPTSCVDFHVPLQSLAIRQEGNESVVTHLPSESSSPPAAHSILRSIRTQDSSMSENKTKEVGSVSFQESSVDPRWNF